MRKMNARGTINVFVALMMIPTIAFTGTMVDISRIFMARVQIRNAAELAVSSAIAYYDGLLQEVYGLYATSQDNEKKRDKFCNEYALAALGLDEKGRKAESSLNLFTIGGPYFADDSNKPKLELKTKPEYSLKNTVYLRYQAGQYMKYRVAFSLFGMFDSIMGQKADFANAGKPDEKVSSKAEDFMNNEYNQIGKQREQLTKSYEALWKAVDEAEKGIEDFNNRIKRSLESIKQKYDELDKEVEQIKAKVAAEAEDSEESEGTDTPEMPEEPEDLYAGLHGTFNEIRSETSTIQYLIEGRKALIDNVKTLAAKIENETRALENMVQTSQNTLTTGSGTDYPSTFAKAVTDDLEENKGWGLGGVGDAGNKFYDENYSQFDTITYGGYTIYDANGTIDSDVRANSTAYGVYNAGDEPRLLIVGAIQDINMVVYPFDRGIYDELKKRTTVTDANKNKEGEFRDKAKDMKADAAKPHTNSGERPDLTYLRIPQIEHYKSAEAKYINEGFVNDPFSELTINRFLLTEYCVQMLSNYVTNRRIETKDGQSAPKTDEETLSGVPFGKEMNYLYRAELEYIIAGNDKASVNHTWVIATLTAIFAVRNLAFTFTDETLKDEIAALRLIPYVGWIVAEVYRVAIVALETWFDIDTLLNGQRVPLSKDPIDGKTVWRASAVYGASAVIGNTIWGPDGKGEGEGMYYYEYLRLMLLFNPTIGTHEMAARLATIIELNMNNRMNKFGGCSQGHELTSLNKFKTNKAYVLVDGNLTGGMPYYFVSMKLFSNLTPSGTEAGKGWRFNVTKTRGY